MNKLLKFTTLLVGIIFSISSHAASQYFGYWSPNCGGFGGSVNITKGDDIKVDVNNNNLYISAKISVETNGYNIYFTDVIESMNELIDWDNISHENPIAIMNFKDDVATMDWLGFYDKSKHKYVWTTQSDFYIFAKKSKAISLTKCHF
ncbi:hypothetical protein [Rahnella contaminans]|uniref:hypothetical protein n=1 Tax=Rahnella contaminans TaxID=2703882 RepID=UPI003C306BCB